MILWTGSGTIPISLGFGPQSKKVTKPANVSVRLGGKIRTSEQLIRLFIRKCKRERIVQEYRETLVFETKGQKRRRKKAQGRARRKREEDSNKSAPTKDKLRR